MPFGHTLDTREHHRDRELIRSAFLEDSSFFASLLLIHSAIERDMTNASFREQARKVIEWTVEGAEHNYLLLASHDFLNQREDRCNLGDVGSARSVRQRNYSGTFADCATFLRFGTGIHTLA